MTTNERTNKQTNKQTNNPKIKKQKNKKTKKSEPIQNPLRFIAYTTLHSPLSSRPTDSQSPKIAPKVDRPQSNAPHSLKRSGAGVLRPFEAPLPDKHVEWPRGSVGQWERVVGEGATVLWAGWGCGVWWDDDGEGMGESKVGICVVFSCFFLDSMIFRVFGEGVHCVDANNDGWIYGLKHQEWSTERERDDISENVGHGWCILWTIFWCVSSCGRNFRILSWKNTYLLSLLFNPQVFPFVTHTEPLCIRIPEKRRSEEVSENAWMPKDVVSTLCVANLRGDTWHVGEVTRGNGWHVAMGDTWQWVTGHGGLHPHGRGHRVCTNVRISHPRRHLREIRSTCREKAS